MTIQIDKTAPGAATLSLGPTGRRLTYRCDADAHRVVVSDEFGRIAFEFGGRGSGPGHFETPVDLTFVRPEFAGEVLPACGPDAVWLAVADYGNRRVQILDLDGVHVGNLELESRIAIGPPCGLRWRSPMLEIEGVEGARTVVHLTAALLCSTSLPKQPDMPMPREWAASRNWVN
jgi:hypothetical protein